MKVVNGILVPETQAELDEIAAAQTPAKMLAQAKSTKLSELSSLVKAHADIFDMIKGGTVTTLTGTQVANYLAASTNNARTLRANIQVAPDQAALDAIDITSGWPANP